jgi:hypothetical protein
MKKNILFILLMFLSVSMFSQEKGYWACFNFSVEKQSDAKELVDAMDVLFSAEEMKQMPFTVFLFEIEFASSTNNFTHQLCFSAPNADYFKGWGSGPGNFPENNLVQKIFESVAKPFSSILASALIFDPVKAGNYNYSNVWTFKVNDVPKFGALASDFIKANSDNFEGVIELHETISGAEDGVTHVMVARSNNLGDWLRGREAVFANPKSQDWFLKSSKYGEMISSFSGNTIRVYPASN